MNTSQQEWVIHTAIPQLRPCLCYRQPNISSWIFPNPLIFTAYSGCFTLSLFFRNFSHNMAKPSREVWNTCGGFRIWYGIYVYSLYLVYLKPYDIKCMHVIKNQYILGCDQDTIRKENNLCYGVFWNMGVIMFHHNNRIQSSEIPIC